tara:strand:+ start:64 stop:405 length:342 start_codon:yes stop_codon:yes gene_type:complete
MQAFIDYKGLTINSFEKSINTRGTIGKFLSEDSNLGINWISKIIETYEDLNIEWFFTGEGKMLKTPAIVDAREAQTSKNLTDFSDLEITEYIAQNLSRFNALATFRKVVGLKD